VRLRSPRAALAAIPVWAWLGGIVGGSVILLALESRAVPFPIHFIDELVYANAAKRLAAGSAPGLDGGAYGYGLVYPLLLAPLYRLFTHTTDAYVAVKLVNAAAFSFAAVPAYLLARRVARSGPALGVALLTVLLPARAYAPLVLTESLAFLFFLLVVLATVRVLERATVKRQLVMLGLGAVAIETRRQFLILALALPLMLAVAAAMERGRPVQVARRIASRYAATWIALATTTVGAVAWSTLREGSLAAGLGPYSVLWRSYEPAAVARWAAYHAAAYGLTLAVIPLIALPFGLATCLRRDAPARHRSVGVATLVLVPVFLLQVAAFSSTPYALDRIHERYLFYVAPLVFAMLARWIDAGLPRARSAAALLVAAVIVALPLLLPLHGLVNKVVDAPVLYALGYEPDVATHNSMPSSFQLIALLLSAFLALWVFLLRPHHGFVLLAIAATTLALVDIDVHTQIARGSRQLETTTTGGHTGLRRDWLDRAVGRTASVTVLYLTPPPTCATRKADTVHTVVAYLRLAFFNSGIRRVVGIDPGLAIDVPVERAALTAGGRVLVHGRPLVTRYLVTDARLELAGHRVAHDPATGLTLWQTTGPARLLHLPPGRRIGQLVCGTPRHSPDTG